MKKKIAAALVLIGVIAIFLKLFSIAVKQTERSRKLEVSIYTLVNNFRAEALEERLRTGGDPNASGPGGEPVICEACVDPGSIEVMRVLLKAGANAKVMCGEVSCLELAVLAQNEDVVSLLLSHFRDIPVEELVRLKNLTSNDVIVDRIEQEMISTVMLRQK